MGLGQHLGTMTQLTSLDVSFRQCAEVNGAGLAGFAKGLRPMHGLGTLRLNFDVAFGDSDTEACNDAGLQLGRTLTGMNDLQELSLRFSLFDNCVGAEGVA